MVHAPSLENLVAALPQVYQPIFGHPELLDDHARTCEDRFAQVAAVHDALRCQLQRPVRVLDLGCAQGWFSLSLAKRGAFVVGGDYSADNINLCNALARENSGLNVAFSLLEIEQLPSLLKSDQFDLVLGMSVFHHLCYQYGKKWTRNLLSLMFERIPVALIETALASEPIKFAVAQPENPYYLIEQSPFFHLLSFSPSLRQSIHRPLFFCSSRYWYFGEEMVPFSNWFERGAGRRYYIGDGVLAKVFRINGDADAENRRSIQREAAFLKSPPDDYHWSPKLLCSGDRAEEAWLVREYVPGTTLSDLINSGQEYDERVILIGVLRQLAALETAGSFHADASIWNVLISENGQPTLINYDEVFEGKGESGWMESPFPSFLVFLRQVVTRQQFEPRPTPGPIVNPVNLPQPYQGWALQLWNQSPAKWSYAFLLESLEKLPALSSELSSLAA
jgi:O-antigen chain-terminating methyltransferase